MLHISGISNKFHFDTRTTDRLKQKIIRHTEVQKIEKLYNTMESTRAFIYIFYCILFIYFTKNH